MAQQGTGKINQTLSYLMNAAKARYMIDKVDIAYI